MSGVSNNEVVTLEGGLKYVGKLLNGLPHGQGKLTWPNGDYYDGLFKYGKRNGMGKRVNTDGSEYQGEYLDDKPNGRGNAFDGYHIRFRHLFMEGW
jgi:hypothetical protein